MHDVIPEIHNQHAKTTKAEIQQMASGGVPHKTLAQTLLKANRQSGWFTGKIDKQVVHALLSLDLLGQVGMDI
jgi:hypothetical protein